MHKIGARFHIGLRTVKTATAVMIAMVIVDAYGATTSKLIFAMLGAMAAVQPTFRESLVSCLTQIVGVLFGAMIGVALLFLPIPHHIATGIGIILVITLYNALQLRYSPSLPCFIVVMLCTTPDISPVSYAFGRTWDTFIGLCVGMLINTLIFPYDNRQQIRATMESLNCEIIRFLEEMFDGDDILPLSDALSKKINDIDRQLKVFANQILWIRPSKRRRELVSFQVYEAKARRLVAHMEVLSQQEYPGRLSEKNRQCLIRCGAEIQDQRVLDSLTKRDVITNYHVEQILVLRQELLELLS
ncbi:MAG: hypothetical protein E7445_00795 [Ruminococcaceae bacterium]|nr:hypothetical protein [Oscillospiraceae bacterium]